MLFLIEYDRISGHIVSMRSFRSELRHDAERERLKLELQLLSREEVREVVLLEAASEEALRKTHRRYFEDVEALAAAS